MEFILILVLLVLAFYLGWKCHEWFMFEALQDSPEIFEKAIAAAKRYGGQEDDIKAEELVEMEIEVVNGVVYAYNKVNGQFLAQASTVTLAAIAASKRFPGVAFTHPDIEMPDQEDQKA